MKNITLDKKYRTRDGRRPVRILAIDVDDEVYSVVGLIKRSTEAGRKEMIENWTADGFANYNKVPGSNDLIEVEEKTVYRMIFINGNMGIDAFLTEDAIRDRLSLPAYNEAARIIKTTLIDGVLDNVEILKI